MWRSSVPLIGKQLLRYVRKDAILWYNSFPFGVNINSVFVLPDSDLTPHSQTPGMEIARIKVVCRATAEISSADGCDKKY